MRVDLLKGELGFYVPAVAAMLLGSLLAAQMGWGEVATFAAGIVPLCLVMLVFMLREPREPDGPGRR